MANKKKKADKIIDALDQDAVLDVAQEALDQEIEATAPKAAAATDDAQQSTASATFTTISVKFYGKDYLAKRFPESIAIVDRLANEWIQDGNFEFLPITNVRAKTLVVDGLKWARTFEKKIEKTIEAKIETTLENEIVKTRILPEVTKIKARAETLLHRVRQ